MTTTPLSLTVNGDLRTIPGPASVTDLLTHLALDPRAVVVELNRTILRRPDLETTPLQDGDTLEVVHFVGGG